MLKVYFNNLQFQLKKELRSTKKSLFAAVAWMSFDEYDGVFKMLLEKGIEVKLVLDDNGSNRKYEDLIKSVAESYPKLFQYRFIRFRGIMHHKFCVIDDYKCISGSFNWTKNANHRNFEDLNVAENKSAAAMYKEEFNFLWKKTDEQLAQLLMLRKCPNCKDSIINILILDEEEIKSQSIVSIVNVCGCELKKGKEYYYEYGLWGEYRSLLDQYYDISERDFSSIEDFECFITKYDIKVRKFLSTIAERCDIKIPIHAVGVHGHEQFGDDPDSFEPVYKIIWKDRIVSSYIEDSYSIKYN